MNLLIQMCHFRWNYCGVVFILNFGEKGFLSSCFLPSFPVGNPFFEIFRHFFLKYSVLILQKNIQKYKGEVENRSYLKG